MRNRRGVREFLPATAPHILAIEDDTGLAEAVELLLSEAGFRFSHAATAREAVRAVHGVDFSLVLLDLTLPDASAEETVRALRATGCSAPIVVLSGAVDASIQAHALGADGFLPKPFDIDALLAYVRRLSREGDADSLALT